ncbi:hypothetical protein [Haloimpatiens massiliensis]|uniref:hypothetical protein n=1 Tax=Haloimpatiens massiliensis TaxID=1658110 RepID=UPI000C8506E3|nr:hypothetical protein [Haloimpatiens massiliensis]
MDFVINDLDLQKSSTFKIHPDLTVKQERYYCVMQNPFITKYDTEVIYGSSVKVLQNKIRRKYNYLKKRRNVK